MEKRRFEPTPPLFGASVWGDVVGISRYLTRVPGLSHGVVCVILALAVFIELRLVPDRQMDTR